MGYLEELAFDLRNSWEHGADDIWRRLDAELWAATHNPQVVLQTVAQTRLRTALADPEFLEKLTSVVLGAATGEPGHDLVPADLSRRAAHLCGLLQHGIWPERSVADLFGRSGQRRGRPTEGRS